MAILITHGYLLTGTGSNLYVNNLVRELVKKGEDVVLVCQDFDPSAIDFVNEWFDFDECNSTAVLKSRKETAFPGRCWCYRPNLNRFLPVYVYDHYEGFEVKEFNNCSDAEVKRYVDQNVAAMSFILDKHEVEVVNTNHLVMFPYIAKLLKINFTFKFVITVHGSALNFTVKKDKRFEQFAIESLKVADEIVVDSLHADEELKEFLDEVGLGQFKQRIEIIPAGVDVNSFGLPVKSKDLMIEDFKSAIKEAAQVSKGRSIAQNQAVKDYGFSLNEIEGKVEQLRQSYDYRGIDQGITSEIDRLNIGQSDNVFFVGKYLWTKGIYLMLCAIPEILRKNPRTNFIIAGFGPFREPAEVILNALAEGKVEELKKLVASSKLFALEGHGNDGGELPLLGSILEAHGDQMKRDVDSIDFDIRERVLFTGILNHAQLVHLLPAMDVLIAPSVFPEAFGMVAIEAASCGVFPVVTYQSAFREIADHIKDLVGDLFETRDVTLDPAASINIAYNVLAFIDHKKTWEADDLVTFKQSLRRLVVENFSWEGIAGKYLVNYRK